MIEQELIHSVLFERHPQPMWIFDSESQKILAVNRAALQTYGYSEAEFLSLSASRFLAGSELPGWQDGYISKPRSILQRTKSGRSLTLELTYSSIRLNGVRAQLLMLQPQSSDRELAGLINWQNSVVIEGIGVWEQDLLSGQIYWNSEMYRLFDLEPLPANQLIQSCLERIHPEDLSVLHSELARSLPPSQHTQRNYRVIHRDGSVRYLESRSRIIYQPDDRASRIVGIIKDVSSQKATEIKLKERDQLLSKLSQRIPGMIYQFQQLPDGSTRMPYTSDGIQALFGLTPAEVYADASHWLQKVHPDVQESLFASNPESLAKMQMRKATYKVYRPDLGSMRWIYGESQPEAQADGSILWHGYLTDITRQKELEMTLAESEERFKLAIEAAGIGVWELNLITGELHWDKRMFELYDMSQAEFSHERNAWVQCLHPDDLELAEDLLNQSASTGRPLQMEFRIIRRDGSIRHIFSMGKVISNAKGLAIRILGINQDISEYKKIEAELRFSKAELEANNTRLKGMLNKMQELAVKAELANTLKSEFLNNMSHELRTPLNGVIGMSELLLESKLDSEQQRFTQVIRQSGQALLAHINHILDFSQLESQQLELENEDFELQALLKQVINLVYTDAYQAGLELLLWSDPQLPRLLSGSKARLGQVLLNLLGNAIKFTPKGQVMLKVSARHSRFQQHEILFEVLDSGIGIPQEQQQRLFQPFSQVDGSMSRKFSGVGLGLVLSKKLVELMNGQIGFSSEQNQGSRFWFSLPLTPQALAPEIQELPLKDLKVQVFCLSELQTRWLELNLTDWGCQVYPMQDPAQLKTDIDVLIIDWQAWLSARAELLKIRSQTSWLLLASSEQAFRLSEEEQARFGLWVAKPLLAEALFNSLQQHLAKSASGHKAVPQVVSGQSEPQILLVEDDPINQLVAEAILRKQHYHFKIAANGVLALSALQAERFDLILMDCQMPEMDGFTATRMIRLGRVENCPSDIPIIAVTAHNLEGDREKCLESGMNDYLAKPFTPEELSHKIQVWLPSELKN